MSPETSLQVGSTIAGLLTLAIMSFLYRDNRIYKFAEHLFVGLAAGYYVALQFRSVLLPNLWNPLMAGDVWNVIPLTLALLLFSRFVPSLTWLSRWPIGLMVGAYSGLSLIGFAQGDLVEQLRANMVSFAPGSPGNETAAQWVGNVLLVFGVIACLVYFFFSTEHRGAIGVTARVGIYFLMVSFGASYGFTVMARISLLIGRLNFLLREWPAAFGQQWLP